MQYILDERIRGDTGKERAPQPRLEQQRGFDRQKGRRRAPVRRREVEWHFPGEAKFVMKQNRGHTWEARGMEQNGAESTE